MLVPQPRVALYSLLTATEEDLRLVLSRGLGVLRASDALGDDLAQRAVDRAHRDLGVRPDTVAELLPYLDFAETWQLVNRHADALPPAWAATSKRLRKQIERLTGTRNRVMHARPLNFDDLPTALEFAEALTEDDTLEVPCLREAMTLLAENPAALDRGLPEPDENESHNLPAPDFEESGFVGRRDVIEHIKTLCLGPYPVITIVGEGGIGKTAAAVKVAYELLDDPRSPFEATVWSTSKTSQLTAGDVVTIEDAISTSIGLMEAVATDLGGTGATDPMEEVLEYLGQFRILLVLDNLETVLDERIRSFLTRLPSGSKVLITSRIGLGTLEHPVKLAKLSRDEGVQLIRSLARVRQVEDLVRMDNRRVAKYCEKMDNNPLWIKWFVSGVQAGTRPEELLAKPDKFLEFSMSNVHGYLSDQSRQVLQAMQVVPGSKTQAELVFLSGLDVAELQQAVAQLCVTNMITMSSTPVGSSFESSYALAELPRTYLAKHHPVEKEAQRRIARKARELQAASQELHEAQKSNPYRVRSLDLRSRGNLIVAKHLLDALDAAKVGEFTKAEQHVATARQLAPEWFEVHRVDALVKAQSGNITGAQEAFEGAIELEPDSAALRLRYGMFLLDHLDDPPGAVAELDLAIERDASALDCKLELVRAHQRNHDFETARRHLTDLFAQQARLTWLKLRMLHDLELQQWMRLAQDLLLAGESERAARALESMKKAFEGCPAKLRDERIQRRLTQALPTAKRVAKQCKEEGARARVEKFVMWAEGGGADQSKRRAHRVGTWATGVVVNLVSDRGFAFVRLYDGEEVFLHFSNLQFDEASLQVGNELTFELGPGQGQGMQALNARPA